jgi:hypothetical protein
LKGFFSGESNDTSQTTSYYKTTTMNSEFVATVSNAANATKAPKKPTLSAKYSRFLSFGHWFLTKTDLNEETRKQLFQQMSMFGTVEEQTTFFEVFFSEIKDTNKVMRKMVAEAKKPPKAPKAPRAKKTKAAPAAQDELVAQLIADANGGEPVAAAATEAPAPKEKKPRAKKVKEVAAAADATTVAADATVAPKEKKPRAKKVKETEPVTEAAAPTTTEPVAEVAAPATEPAATEPAAPKEKKPRAKKADAAEKPKKTKKTEAAPAAPVDEATEDVQTRVVTIGDKEYLIDAENNLYDTNFPHDQVGTFNPETGAIQA